MDDFSINDNRIDKALDELKLINKYLGGISTTRFGLKSFKNLKINSIIDVGSGASDILLSFNNKKKLFTIISIDKNSTVVKYLKQQDKDSINITSDAFTIPLKDKSCDLIHSSLFLHHFDEEQIVELIREYLRVCRIGIIINDLRRSFFALAGITLLTKLFSKSTMVKNDAPLSVKRGFIRSDLVYLMKKAGVKNFSIYPRWAFRWLVVVKN